MTMFGWAQALIVFLIVTLCVKPLGIYMARIFNGETVGLSRVLGPVERGFYRLCGIRAEKEMAWQEYAFALLAFSMAGFVYLYVLLRTQAWLPLNPQNFANMAPDLAWNTAISFLTNTNWQFYSGESTLSALTQMAGLGWHMFVSAGAGIAVAIAVMRGLTRSASKTLGNFWVDMTRAVLYVLLPLSIVMAVALMWQGIPQNFHAYDVATTLEHAKQTIPQGPMASLESIKELGTNGGGYVNANSAAPFENPTALSNLIEMCAMFLISAALTYTYGRFARDQRQGWVLFATMSILFFGGFTALYAAEAAGNPLMHHIGIAGASLEGKETRFGIASSALFATMTTDTSTGAVNCMHDSLMPLAGLVTMVNMQLSEVIFGGVGCGFYGMIVLVVLTVFIAGLMVGRTPEYLGKKIERREVQFAILISLVVPVFVLIPSAIAAVLPLGTATLNNSGPHGFSEILYAFTSATNNNGSAFAGLGGNTFWDITMGISMLFGRFAMLIPILALAGSLAKKQTVPATAGSFSTTSSIFVVLLIGTIVIVGALTFFPADALGPIVEHLLMLQGKVSS